MTAYYNEIDPYAAEWLRRLIAAGHIALGVVDTRSITELNPDELRTYTQCHFFAGIGVWSHALRTAGWPDSRPVWTGSCPCQPFSSAGKRLGTADERHLWPAFAKLIAECKPAAVFGEQVASGAGRDWLASVRADLEGMGYAVGAADLCAAGTGAPHIRQRLYWVADAAGERRNRVGVLLRQDAGGWNEGDLPEAARGGSTGGLADADNARHQRNSGAMDCPRSSYESQEPQLGWSAQAAGHCGETDGLADANYQGLEGRCGVQERADERAAGQGGLEGGPRTPDGFWSAPDWLWCRDGKWRPVESGTEPLATGAASRVGRLRAYGNALCAPVATAFVEAFLKCKP